MLTPILCEDALGFRSELPELPADLIVFATGYNSMNGWAEQLISREAADRVGECWGFGSGTRYDHPMVPLEIARGTDSETLFSWRRAG